MTLSSPLSHQIQCSSPLKKGVKKKSCLWAAPFWCLSLRPKQCRSKLMLHLRLWQPAWFTLSPPTQTLSSRGRSARAPPPAAGALMWTSGLKGGAGVRRPCGAAARRRNAHYSISSHVNAIKKKKKKKSENKRPVRRNGSISSSWDNWQLSFLYHLAEGEPPRWPGSSCRERHP